MSSVAIVSSEDYSRNNIEHAVNRAVELLGGISRFVKSGERILLKPNILVPDPPEKCSTTHPEVLRAAAVLLKSAGAKVSYGDSPGTGSTNWACRGAGYYKMMNELGVEPAEFKSGRVKFFEGGLQNKKFTIADPVLDADGVVSLPKMKTHSFQKVTGALKNQFGCIPGLRKGQFHVKIPNANFFARMLVDLNQAVHPRLYIMDAVKAMEGNGPRGGTPRKVGLIMASDDPVALDATMCRLMNLDPALVPAITSGVEAGAGVMNEHEITILGEDLRQYILKDYKVDRHPIRPYKPNRTLKFLNHLIIPKPYIIEGKCIRCGLCVKVCPAEPKALTWPSGKGEGISGPVPVYDYSKCIRCYCCQEMCPESAVETARLWQRRRKG
ncbi:MAG: DUF362 domain-containing protein [Spirochaetia bacterium]